MAGHQLIQRQTVLYTVGEWGQAWVLEHKARALEHRARVLVHIYDVYAVA